MNRRCVSARTSIPTHTKVTSDQNLQLQLPTTIGSVFSVMPRIPLLEDLTKEPIPPGSNLLVEYDPTSLWYAASLTITAVWMKTGGRIGYVVAAQPPDKLRSRLARLGVNAEEAEKNEKLRIFDFYTATLGRKSKEKYAVESLKVADLSIWFSKIGTSPLGWGWSVHIGPDMLRIRDDLSCLGRFNDEKIWVEFMLTRLVPLSPEWKSHGISAVMRGVHNEWVYKQLEAAADGVIDFKLEESGEEPTTLVRIRSMRDVGFDGRWHNLNIGQNFEVTLEK